MNATTHLPWARSKAAARAIWKFFIPEWGFKSAQMYEFMSAKGTIKRSFAIVFDNFEKEKARNGLWHKAGDRFFNSNVDLFDAFALYVRDRRCLEIGSGPYGYLAPCYWIKNRVVIDPLISKYRDYQLRKFGKTFWTPDIETYATPAEQIINKLRGNVDGAIICQNALDHTEDPLGVLNAISEYAAQGCYFLLWTDIWHLKGTDIGHRNITRSVDVMPKLISGLGFDILHTGETIRGDHDMIEYGCVARKR